MVKKLFIGSVNFLGNMSASLIGFIIGVYAARLLTLEQYGALSLVKYILIYSGFYSLGIMEAVYYRMPAIVASGDKTEITFHEHFLFTIASMSTVLLLIAGVFALIGVPLNSVTLRWEWVIIGVTVVVGAYNYYINILYHSYQKFLNAGLAKLLGPLVHAPLFFLIIKPLQLNGYLLAMLGGSITAFFVGLVFIRNKIGFTWDNTRFKDYLKVGIPIRLGGIFGALFLSIDLWLISYFLGSKKAGLYGFILISRTAFMLLPGFLQQFINPRLSWFFGKAKQQVGELSKPFKMVGYALSLISAVSIVLTMVFFHFLIHHFLPKYSEVRVLIPIFLSSYLVGIVGMPCYTILVILKKQVRLMVNLILVFVFVAILDVIAVVVFKRLEAMAASTAIGIVVMGSVNIVHLIRTINLEGFRRFLVVIAGIVIVGFGYIWLCYFTLMKIGGDFFDFRLYLLLLPILFPLFLAYKYFVGFWDYTRDYKHSDSDSGPGSSGFDQAIMSEPGGF